jgi:hypothetical protein
MSEYRVLSSKKLTKSFKAVEDGSVYESINLSADEVKQLIASAIQKLSKDTPLTITISIIK